VILGLVTVLRRRCDEDIGGEDMQLLLSRSVICPSHWKLDQFEWKNEGHMSVAVVKKEDMNRD
jgi:hypothetical protein